MRKFIVGLLMVGGLSTMAAPAMAAQVAQAQGGLGDPLTLAASGVLIPFLQGSGDVSLLEVASPVGSNAGAHMFFYDQSCARVGDSVGLPATTNDIAFLQIPTVGLPATVTGGLITIGQVDASGFALTPLASPIHTRVYVFNVNSGRSRVIEPIILDTAEFPGDPHTWSPLRTGATFFAPQETAAVQTRVFFSCPLDTIQTATGGAFPGTLFPVIVPHFPHIAATDALRVRIYDTNEVLWRDTRTACNCIQEESIAAISNFYADPLANLGTFSEVESNPVASNATENVTENVFTGYVATATVGSAVNNFVHRMSNGSRSSLQGTLLDAR
jgi:hypothetical protein